MLAVIARKTVVPLMVIDVSSQKSGDCTVRQLREALSLISRTCKGKKWIDLGLTNPKKLASLAPVMALALPFIIAAGLQSARKRPIKLKAFPLEVCNLSHLRMLFLKALQSFVR